MKLFNTLGRRMEDFKPIKDGQVSLYTCGPTVYDYAQLGNLRSFVFDDTLRRMLATSGLEVKHVMNITDVGHLASDMDEGQDKLEKGAEREGKSVWDVANFYTEAFIKDAAALNILPPNGYSGKNGPYARATDFIDEQIDIVKLLVDKGFAYQTKQAIYFDVKKLPSYGELSGQKLEDKEVGARQDVVTDQQKRSPQDFALWFFRVGRFAHHSMYWPSPWGDGFPGWHLECSAIIHATLGDPVDIHTGGVDHIGTHHTNETAQTEAAFGHKLANIWMHNEFLLADGQKMAKSAGNFYTLADVTKRGYEPLALRLLFLQAHYRSQQNFTWEALEGAQNRLASLRAWADRRWQAIESAPSQAQAISRAKQQVLAALHNDLNTPEALAALNDIIDTAEALNPTDVQAFTELLEYLDEVFGLNLSASADISAKQKRLIGERQAAREAQDWQKADALRQELAEQAIDINDTKYGSTWSRSR